MEKEQVQEETIKMGETREQPSRLEGIGAVISVGVLGFWFGIGTTFGSKTVNSLEELKNGIC